MRTITINSSELQLLNVSDNGEHKDQGVYDTLLLLRAVQDLLL